MYLHCVKRLQLYEQQTELFLCYLHIYIHIDIGIAILFTLGTHTLSIALLLFVYTSAFTFTFHFTSAYIISYKAHDTEFILLILVKFYSFLLRHALTIMIIPVVRTAISGT